MIKNNKNFQLKGTSETTCGITNKEKENLDWFMGFLEGDGSWFIRSNHTLGLEISQHSKDSQTLYYIKTLLKFGKVYHNKSKNINVSRYSLGTKPNNIACIVKLVNQRFRTSYGIERFNSWAKKAIEWNLLNERVNLQDIPIKPTWDDGWLSGFIDAEGCFRITKYKNCYTLVFEITQKEKNVLENIELLFPNFKGKLRKDKEVYVLKVSSKRDQDLLIKYIEKFPLKTRKKSMAMKIWKKAHNLQKKKGENEQLGILKIKINKWTYVC